MVKKKKKFKLTLVPVSKTFVRTFSTKREALGQAKAARKMKFRKVKITKLQ